MLDTLAEAWAADNDGANIWADKTVRFLDPCTKSGVFLREITSRLTKGLADEIPDLEERVDHILTKQVFGIGITHLTSLLARRSVYCSKHANGKHSIAKSFASDDGNIWFERTEHTWVDGKCRYCGASQTDLRPWRRARNPRLCVHPHRRHQDSDGRVVWRRYAVRRDHRQPAVPVGRRRLRHERCADLPAVRGAGARTRPALPVYGHSVALVGRRARGSTSSASAMLADKRMRSIVDYPKLYEVLPGREDSRRRLLLPVGSRPRRAVRGADHLGRRSRRASRRALPRCVTTSSSGATRPCRSWRRCRAKSEPTLDCACLSRDKPFGLATNFHGKPTTERRRTTVKLYRERRRPVVDRSREDDHDERRIDRQVEGLHADAVQGTSASETTYRQFLSTPIIAEPGIGLHRDLPRRSAASTPRPRRRAVAVLPAHAVRSLPRLAAQDHPRRYRETSTPSFPTSRWTEQWTDAELYKKYGLTEDEIAFIESHDPSDGRSDDGDDE